MLGQVFLKLLDCGGWVQLNGRNIIEQGKFNYLCPCTKIGKQTFKWTDYFTTKKSSLFFTDNL